MKMRSRTPEQLVHDITNHHYYLRHSLRAQSGTNIRIPRSYLASVVRTLARLLALQDVTQPVSVVVVPRKPK